MVTSPFEVQKTDMELQQFAELSAIKGYQFGREVYSGVIKFKDLQDFLDVFPEVQREVIPRKVNSLRRYIISGLEGTEELNMRFFSAVTVTCKGNILYSEKNQRIAIDVNQSKLSINDGQHRFFAVSSAIEYLEQMFVKSQDKDKTSKIKSMIDELKEMIFPIVIFEGLSEKEEKQLFYDLNNLAQRPSRSANIRLNQKDLYSIMARELSTENKYLAHYGVEMDKQSLSPSNKNGLLLTTIYNSIKALLTSESKYNKNFLRSENYEEYKEMINETFDKLFYVLPSDLNVKGKYLLEKSYAIKAICRFISHGRNHLDLQLSEDEIFETIKSIDYSLDNVDFWSKYNGMLGANNHLVFAGGTSGGFGAIYNALIDKSQEVISKTNNSEQMEANVG